MSKKKDDTVWISCKFDSCSLGYESVEKTISRLQEALLRSKEEGWKDLHLEYDYDHGDSQYLYIFGKRPENAKEKGLRLALADQQANYERQQYEALKKKFENK